jgi:hypothetical protein
MAEKGNHKKKNPKDLTPQGIKKAATAELTKLIRSIGGEAHTVDNKGTGLTKIETLARLVWDRALGGTIRTVTDSGVKETVVPPDKAFIGMIWDRLEGRVAPAVSNDGKNKAKLSDRVKEQSKRRLNQMSKNIDANDS